MASTVFGVGGVEVRTKIALRGGKGAGHICNTTSECQPDMSCDQLNMQAGKVIKVCGGADQACDPGYEQPCNGGKQAVCCNNNQVCRNLISDQGQYVCQSDP